MTVLERLEDISNRSGMSKEIVKRVLISTRESIENSLTRKETACIPGIVTYNVKKRVDGYGVKVRVSNRIIDHINTHMQDNIEKEETIPIEYIEVSQIQGLM